MRLPIWGGWKVDLKSIEWRSIELHSINSTSALSEVLSPQIAPLSCLLLPKLSTLVDCCLQWVVQHLQAFCMLLAAHRHHIVVVPSSSSNRRRPIAVLKTPLSSTSTSSPSAAGIVTIAITVAVIAAVSVIAVIAVIVDAASTTLLSHRCIVVLFGGQSEELDQTTPPQTVHIG